MNKQEEEEYLKILESLDETSSECLKYAERIQREIRALSAVKKNKLAIRFFEMALQIGVEFYKTADNESKEGRLLGAAACNRSGLENLADVHYVITDNKDKMIKRAQKYVDSYDIYKQAMDDLEPEKMDIATQKRNFKQINSWTTSKIDDRIKGSGQYTTAMYDWLSHFSHPNPGALIYYKERDYLILQCKLVRWFNCITMLLLLRLISIDLKTKTATTSEIQSALNKLSVKLSNL